MKKNEFFSRHIDHEIEIELEKNLRIGLITGFFSKNLVSSQKTSDARCCQFLFLFHFFLPFLGGRRLELFIQDPIVQKVRNLKYNSGKRHQQKQLKTLLKLVLSQALYVLTSFISAEIMRKSLSAELRQKIILNSYVLRQAKIRK